jgi:hypothetical protein
VRARFGMGGGALLRRSNSSVSGTATNAEEYVPTNRPMSSARAKSVSDRRRAPSGAEDEEAPQTGVDGARARGDDRVVGDLRAAGCGASTQVRGCGPS